MVEVRRMERAQTLVQTAVKHDGGTDKPSMGLIPQASLMEVAKVLDFGAQKYARHNWLLGMDHSRLSDAALRHIAQYLDGQETDDESGLDHLAHGACCLLMLLQYRLKELGNDDRYKG